MDNYDWTTSVDTDHLAEVRRDPARYAPGGTRHLVLGTSVRFRPGPAVTPSAVDTLPDLVELARAGWPHLTIEVRDETGRPQDRS